MIDKPEGFDLYPTYYVAKLEAKVNELEMQLVPLQQQFEDWAEQNREYHATDARRLELLVEVRQLLDAVYAEDTVSSGDLGKVYEKIEKELADD